MHWQRLPPIRADCLKTIGNDGKVVATVGKAAWASTSPSPWRNSLEEPDLCRDREKPQGTRRSADELKAITLKTPNQRTKVGQSLPQLDIPSKTNGACKYGIDAFAPGMLYGTLAIPPVRYGATVKSVDDSEAKKAPGFVKAVVDDDKTATTTGSVVVVATSYEGDKKAAEALKIDWDKGPNARCPITRSLTSCAAWKRRARKASSSSTMVTSLRRWRRRPR